ncbi:MAG: Ppx/GppA family phosphatase [Balneolaceae bacterium]|nr:Ppx/GppA family phosphatase [Balneolaceae bacterium]
MRAAIDIGTNTVLLLIAKEGESSLEVLEEGYRMPRLGKGVDANHNLNTSSIRRVLDVLNEYQQIIEEKYPECEKVIVTATSAVRDAENRDLFLSKVKEETGFDVRLLSGDEEAQYTYRGALATVDHLSDDEAFVVLDIGGGSTEIAAGFEGALSRFTSLDVGCVRFTERYLKHNPPYTEEIFECREAIREALAKQKVKIPKKAIALGVAGTMTSLAAIDLQIDETQISRLNGHKIDREKLSKSIEVFSLHTYDQLLELNPSVLKGREDVFLAGLLILDEFLKFYSLDEILVSTGGMRHGALLMDKKD